MTTPLLVGLVATAVALLGALGRKHEGNAWPSQMIVIALPLGIIAAGYSASIGINLGWTLVACASVFLAILAGGLLGQSPGMREEQTRPATTGLSLALSGLIALGLGAIVLLWASHLIQAFSYLDGFWTRVVLVLAAAVYAIGSGAALGLSRTILALMIVGAVGMFAIGFVGGDASGLTDPQVPVPALTPSTAILYAIGTVLIGAGYPVLRMAGDHNRARVWTSAVVVTLVVLVTLLGMLMLYGGAFQLPSLVLNVLPVYTPELVGSVICGLLTIVAVVVVGGAINAAAQQVARVQPAWYTDSEDHRGPRRIIAFAMAGLVLILAEWAPDVGLVVAMLAAMGLANIVCEWLIHRARTTAAA